jgi:hypothetical protein
VLVGRDKVGDLTFADLVVGHAPLEERTHALANVLFKERDGIIFNRSTATARSSLNRPAHSAVRASCLSVSARHTASAASMTG